MICITSRWFSISNEKCITIRRFQQESIFVGHEWILLLPGPVDDTLRVNGDAVKIVSCSGSSKENSVVYSELGLCKTNWYSCFIVIGAIAHLDRSSELHSCKSIPKQSDLIRVHSQSSSYSNGYRMVCRNVKANII